MKKSYEEVKAPIEGVNIYLNKIVSDERGHFLDLAETDNPAIVNAIKHIHSAVALYKGVSRGEHYHHRVKEDFYILSGTALGILHDFNKKSSTFGKTYAYLSGNKPENIETDLPTFYMEDGKLAQFHVEPKIWHAWWPITNEKVLILATGTLGYDPTDYEKPTAKDIPGVQDILKKFDIE